MLNYFKNLSSWLRFTIAFVLVFATAQSIAMESVIIVQSEEDQAEAQPQVYDRALPIWGQEAFERGYELPKPFGFSVIYMDLSQPLVVEDIGLRNLGLLDDKLNIATSPAVQEGKNITFRADMWVLPFLNLYAIFGKTEGVSRATIEEVSCTDRFNPLCVIINNLPLAGLPFNLNYDGGTYGMGATIAGGVGNWFIMNDMNYTYTDLNILYGKISTFVMSPRVGYRFNTPRTETRVWIGAMYQDVQQNFSGNLMDIGFPQIPGAIGPDSKFDISQRLVERWNGTVGAMLEFDKSYEVLVEVGFGERTSAMASLGYRF